jgi:hypothetical protein
LHFPTRWDPFFKDYITLGEIYRYPGQHFDIHKHQLALNRQSTDSLTLRAHFVPQA